MIIRFVSIFQSHFASWGDASRRAVSDAASYHNMRKRADVICISLHALLVSVSKPSHSSFSLQSAAYISLSISLSFALLFGEDVCRRLGWMRLRCLPLMPEEKKGAHALDRAQLR